MTKTTTTIAAAAIATAAATSANAGCTDTTIFDANDQSTVNAVYLKTHATLDNGVVVTSTGGQMIGMHGSNMGHEAGYLPEQQISLGVIDSDSYKFYKVPNAMDFSRAQSFDANTGLTITFADLVDPDGTIDVGHVILSVNGGTKYAFAVENMTFKNQVASLTIAANDYFPSGEINNLHIENTLGDGASFGAIKATVRNCVEEPRNRRDNDSNR